MMFSKRTSSRGMERIQDPTEKWNASGHPHCPATAPASTTAQSGQHQPQRKQREGLPLPSGCQMAMRCLDHGPPILLPGGQRTDSTVLAAAPLPRQRCFSSGAIEFYFYPLALWLVMCPAPQRKGSSEVKGIECLFTTLGRQPAITEPRFRALTAHPRAGVLIWGQPSH